MSNLFRNVPFLTSLEVSLFLWLAVAIRTIITLGLPSAARGRSHRIFAPSLPSLSAIASGRSS